MRLKTFSLCSITPSGGSRLSETHGIVPTFLKFGTRSWKVFWKKVLIGITLHPSSLHPPRLKVPAKFSLSLSALAFPQQSARFHLVHKAEEDITRSALSRDNILIAPNPRSLVEILDKPIKRRAGEEAWFDLFYTCSENRARVRVPGFNWSFFARVSFRDVILLLNKNTN